MSTNLHDYAYELEKAIRNSDEFAQLKMFHEMVNNDESARGIFDNFRNIQMHLQQKQMMGEDISDEEVEQAEKALSLVQQTQSIVQLMEAEQKMSTVIGEISKIMMKPLDELYGTLEQQF